MNQLSQSQQLRLLQRLSPQQIQGIKLLELPTLLLEARIKAEVEENPVLEEIEQRSDDSDDASVRSTIEDFLRAEEASNSYKLRSNNYSSDDVQYHPTIEQGKTLGDFLIEQLAYYDLSEKQFTIANFIVGTLDDDGYLRRDMETIVDDLAFTQGVVASNEEVEAVIKVIQQLDPSGICARSLSECLLIQLRQLRTQTKATINATRILGDFFDEFLRKHYDKIMLKMGLNEDQLRDAIEAIMSLNPKPANGYSDESVSSSPTIVPDFILDYDDVEDVFDLQLSSRGIPELKINTSYLKMAERALGGVQSETDREALQFVKQKIESARWFIAAVKQRQQTLTKTMRAILDFQREYFKEGDSSKLKPMILKDIAELAGFDISTISRVVNSKYIQTHFGVFLLKYFFSEGLYTESGEEVSTLEIKRILKECVENEDSSDPLTDEALMQRLQGKGYKIARRTVAKYREMLNIPVARLRKKL